MQKVDTGAMLRIPKIDARVDFDAVAVNTAILTDGCKSALSSPTWPYHFLNGVPWLVLSPL